jgi:cytochrome c556
MQRTTLAVTLFVLAACAPAAFGQAKPEVLVDQRQAVMKLQGKYFGPLVLMSQGKLPYDAAVVTRNAGYLHALARMPWDGFEPSTQGLKSRALPEVFKDTAGFKTAADKLVSEVDKLDQAAKSGNEASVKAAVADVNKACNGCHENFRERR